MSTIEKLEKCLARATRPPWVKWVGHGEIVAGPVNENYSGCISGMRCNVAQCDDLEVGDLGAQRNARLIVAAVNALPALLAVAKAAKVAEEARGEDSICEALNVLRTALRALEEVKP